MERRVGLAKMLFHLIHQENNTSLMLVIVTMSKDLSEELKTKVWLPATTNAKERRNVDHLDLDTKSQKKFKPLVE